MSLQTFEFKFELLFHLNNNLLNFNQYLQFKKKPTISENLYNISELKVEKIEYDSQNYWFICFGTIIPIMTVCIGIGFFCSTRKNLKKETSGKLYFIIEIISCLIFLLLSIMEEVGLSSNTDVVESLMNSER